MLGGRYVDDTSVKVVTSVASRAKEVSLTAAQAISDGRVLAALERVIRCAYERDDVVKLPSAAAIYFNVVRCGSG